MYRAAVKRSSPRVAGAAQTSLSERGVGLIGRINCSGRESGREACGVRKSPARSYCD